MVTQNRFKPLKGQRGATLVEALFLIGFMAVFTLPMFLILGQNADTQAASSFQFTRDVVLNSLMDQIDADNPNFTGDYNDSTIQTLTVGSVTIPYLRKVDVSNSNTFLRRIHFYTYRSPTDAITAPATQQTRDYAIEELNIDVGNTSQYEIDPLLTSWVPDLAYNASNKVPGFVSGGSIASISNNITNTSLHDEIYQTYRTGTPLSYRFDVANGPYTVQLYFVEPSTSVNASNNRRLIDITIEESVVLTGFSPFEVLTSANTGHIRVFDTTVSDGALNVVLSRSASSNQDPVLSAITVIRR
jgi:hypothetical protein